MGRKPLEQLLERTTNPDVRDAIRMRRDTASDLSKLLRMQQHTMQGDGRLRNQFRFAGANTSRWTSKSVQIHNMSRGLRDSQGYLVGGEARKIMQADAGRKFFISDFAQIELRIVLWLTGHQEEMEFLHNGNDLYMRLAKQIFGDGAGKEERRRAKGALIACMYGSGSKTIQTYLDMETLQEAEELRNGVHARFPGFMRAQRTLGDMMVAAIYGRTGTYNKKISFIKSGKSVAMILPTGRRVWYHAAHVPPTEDDDYYNKILFAYEFSGKRREVLYGWTVLENACQSFAREFLARTIVNMGRHPQAIPVAHVHDEIICEVDDALINDDLFNGLHALMTDFGEDCPSDLCLAAESTWSDAIGKRPWIEDAEAGNA